MGDAGLAEHLEVVRKRGLGDGGLHRAASLLLAVGKRPHDLEPYRVAQGVEHLGEVELLCAWMVKCSQACSRSISAEASKEG